MLPFPMRYKTARVEALVEGVEALIDDIPRYMPVIDGPYRDRMYADMVRDISGDYLHVDDVKAAITALLGEV